MPHGPWLLERFDRLLALDPCKSASELAETAPPPSFDPTPHSLTRPHFTSMSTIELRQRPNAAKSKPTRPSPSGGDDDASFGASGGRGLSAQVLLNSSPAQDGMVLKLHVPALYPFVPSCLQRILSSRWLRVLNMYPRWTERHLILIGKYLYRFDDNATKPKGAPVPVEAINVHVCERGGEAEDDDMEFIWDYLPPGCDSIFTVSTFGKTQYFACANREDASTWVNSLSEARQSAITRTMGHASNMPYPAAWKYIDSLGTSLVKSKDRVRKKLAETNMKQMDVVAFGDVAGPLPRGYYG